MAKISNKEKMARRRARIKGGDPVKRAELLEKDRLRKAKYRKQQKESMSEPELKKLRAKESERVKCWYHNKKGEPATIEKNSDIPLCSTPFKTKQSLGKAMKKIQRNLPQSPRKRQHVVQCLANQCGFKVTPPIGRTRQNEVSEKLRKWVHIFYQNDDVSWQAPGKKDRVIYKDVDKDGNKVKREVQARYLLVSLGEAYKVFVEKHPQVTICRAKFCALRPKHCKLFSQIPHFVCVCSYHENVRLLLLALKDFTDLPTDFDSFITTLVCDASSKDCMTNRCESCTNSISQHTPKDEDLRKPLKYSQWQNNDGHSEKMEILSSVQETFEDLKSKLKDFLVHTYIKRIQAKTFETIKSNVNGSEIVIQVDFAENASLVNQNEIQSAHWSHGQSTLFTIYAWINKNLTEGCVIVSDDFEHTKLQVFCYINHILTYLKTSYPDISTVNVFSDGASSQFKNRFIFSVLAKLEEIHTIKLKWHFFATSHGKGVVDGIGGTIKRSVWNHVKASRSIVNTPEKFARIAAERNPNITVCYITAEENRSKNNTVAEIWAKALPVANTHSVHCVTPVGNKYILVGGTSDSNEVFRKVKISRDEGSNSEGDIMSNSTKCNHVNLDDWVIVKYDGKLFPGLVKKLRPDYVDVSVMHLSDTGSYYKWPSQEDCISYLFSDVVKKIDAPIVTGSRGQFQFTSKI
ncbi:uncharacterized protein LOC134529662 [Bacillus rossius redtenbacheri]|uniref:uncharacterized protein LOC134529662 n=1 Tax=Bacillus rossius redtenbacheri TaxID=93214 RepID=UPI002FDD93AA